MDHNSVDECSRMVSVGCKAQWLMQTCLYAAFFEKSCFCVCASKCKYFIACWVAALSCVLAAQPSRISAGEHNCARQKHIQKHRSHEIIIIKKRKESQHYHSPSITLHDKAKDGKLCVLLQAAEPNYSS